MPLDARGLLAGQTIADKYLLGSVLGAGGMGTVYRATQRIGKVERTVAVKVLRPALARSPVAVERFLREVETTCQLHHPNTVRIYDFGQTADGALYMVMEHLIGHTLDRLILDAAPLPVVRAVHIMTQVCDALAEAHARGIIHRDIKPSNVFLVEQNQSADFVKVLDFGIAKVPLVDGEPTLTQTGMLPGSPPYMCPEYIKGETIDARADIYSIGCICFEMLCGRRPFSGHTPIAVLTAHVEQPVPSIFEWAGATELPRNADQLIERALAKDPNQRFADVGELRQALQQLAIEPTVKKVFGPAGQVKLASSRTLSTTQEQALTDVQRRPGAPIEDEVTGPLLKVEPEPTRPDGSILPTREKSPSRVMLGAAAAIAAVAVSAAIGLLVWNNVVTEPGSSVASTGPTAEQPEPLSPVKPVEPVAAAGTRLSAEETEDQLKAAREAIAADDFGAAEAALTKVLKSDPGNETAKVLFERVALERAALEDVATADADYKAGRLEDALIKLDGIADVTQARVRALKRANKIRNELVDGHEKKARAALESEDFEAARSEVEAGLKLVPQNPTLKDLQREIDNSEQVAIARAPVVGKKPPSDKKKPPPVAANEGGKAGKSNPDEANRLYLEGNRYILQGRFKDAIDKFKQALVADSKFADAHRGLGIVYAKLEKNDLAVHHYELYLQLRPFAPDADRVRVIVREYKATKGSN